MKVIIITEQDIEYGYDIFVDVVSNKETALEVCKELIQNSPCKKDIYGKFTVGFMNKYYDQIGILKDGKPYSTIYSLEEREVK